MPASDAGEVATPRAMGADEPAEGIGEEGAAPSGGGGAPWELPEVQPEDAFVPPPPSGKGKAGMLRQLNAPMAPPSLSELDAARLQQHKDQIKDEMKTTLPPGARIRGKGAFVTLNGPNTLVSNASRILPASQF